MKCIILAVAGLSGLIAFVAQAQSRPAITGIAFARFYVADAAASEEF
jgi:hypothetical protein